MTDIAVIGVFATVTSDKNYFLPSTKTLSSFVAMCLAIFCKSDYKRMPEYGGREGTNEAVSNRMLPGRGKGDIGVYIWDILIKSV